jgi:hypothetical protein
VSAGSCHGLRDGSPNAPRRLVRGIAIAATLIVALLPPASASADDPGAIVPPSTTVNSLPGSSAAVTSGQTSVDTTAVTTNDQTTSSGSQNNTATNKQTTTTTGGNGGTAAGGKAGPAEGVGSGSQSSSRGGTASANGGRAESHTSLVNEQSSHTSGQAGSGAEQGVTRHGNPGGRDRFAVEKRGSTGGAGIPTSIARYPALFGQAVGDTVTALEAMERLAHEAAMASPMGGGLPGHPSPVPSQNPFFSLLNSPGSADAGLVMLVLFAVLAASFTLQKQSFSALRMPADVWRPLAYVPPIELPG